MSLAAEAPANLETPASAVPIRSVQLVRNAAGISLHLGVDPGVLFEVRREEEALVVLFGAGRPIAEAGEEEPADLRGLYPLLFPLGGGPVGEVVVPGAADVEPAREDEPDDGSWSFGSLRLRPGVTVTYVNAETTLLETPVPVRDQYFQIQPQLGLQLTPFGNRYVVLSYEPRFRMGSSFAIVRETSHLFTARAEVPAGAFALVRGSYHYATGVLETDEVDPGREYFFDLSRYERNSYEIGARFQRGGRLDVDVSFGGNDVRVDSQQFFDYDRRAFTAQLGYELAPNVRAGLGYTYDELPTAPDRPQAEFTAHSFHLDLEGDLAPRLTGDVSVGYRDQRNPQASVAGQRFRGIDLRAGLARTLGYASRLELRFVRGPYPSAFQQNGFFVTTAGEARLTVPLPLYFSLSGGVGYHRNAYELMVSELGEPREDSIFAWSVGLGRSVTRWAFLRVDYRRERRRSNLAAFDIDTDGLTIQLGVGSFGGFSR